jgi:hypothetical protein
MTIKDGDALGPTFVWHPQCEARRPLSPLLFGMFTDSTVVPLNCRTNVPTYCARIVTV